MGLWLGLAYAILNKHKQIKGIKMTHANIAKTINALATMTQDSNNHLLKAMSKEDRVAALDEAIDLIYKLLPEDAKGQVFNLVGELA
jgi:hypothetical protein